MRLSVTTGVTEYPVSVDKVKEHLRIGADRHEHNILLGTLIAAACEDVGHELRRSIGVSAYKLTLDAFPANGEGIMLYLPPLVSIAGFTYKDTAGAVVTVPSQNYYIDQQRQPEYVVPVAGYEWPETLAETLNVVTIDYTAGYTEATLPPTLAVYLTMLVGSMFENREAHSDSPVSALQFVPRLLDKYRVYK